jgi:hypothetical protein
MAKNSRSRRNHKKGGSPGRSRTTKRSAQVGIPMPEHRREQILQFEERSARFSFPDMTEEEREQHANRRSAVLNMLRFKRGTSDWSKITTLGIAISHAINMPK